MDGQTVVRLRLMESRALIGRNYLADSDLIETHGEQDPDPEESPLKQLSAKMNRPSSSRTSTTYHNNNKP